MSEKNDGGPAFPNEPSKIQDGNISHVWDGLPGMSLRDYFAGQVLISITGELMRGSGTTKELIAETAYEIADAMLVARAK